MSTDTIHCRWRDPAAPDDGRSLHCGNVAVDIAYDSGTGRVLSAWCELHRDRGLAMVEVDGRSRTASHALLVGSVAGTVEGFAAELAHNLGMTINMNMAINIGEAAIEALFATQAMRRIIRRHLAEREHLGGGA